MEVSYLVVLAVVVFCIAYVLNRRSLWINHERKSRLDRCEQQLLEAEHTIQRIANLSRNYMEVYGSNPHDRMIEEYINQYRNKNMEINP